MHAPLFRPALRLLIGLIGGFEIGVEAACSLGGRRSSPAALRMVDVSHVTVTVTRRNCKARPWVPIHYIWKPQNISREKGAASRSKISEVKKQKIPDCRSLTLTSSCSRPATRLTLRSRERVGGWLLASNFKYDEPCKSPVSETRTDGTQIAAYT